MPSRLLEILVSRCITKELDDDDDHELPHHTLLLLLLQTQGTSAVVYLVTLPVPVAARARASPAASCKSCQPAHQAQADEFAAVVLLVFVELEASLASSELYAS